jgi:alkanesulfonate monooxygenase SsuD/methylene tetrahydromethanopterin reductase-like flavin-dependent oxidoreductase (luciferase family)
MIHSADLTFDEIIALGQHLENTGYHGYWLTEESGKEAFSLLALIAANTKTITLGTAIINFYSRTPMLLAMGTRTIDSLSGGRFQLGLGTGGIGFMEQGHGIEIDRPISRSKEVVEIVRKFLSEDRFSYDGKWFNVKKFHLREGPLDHKVPIYQAALGPQMIKTAAKYYDGFIANWVTPQSLAGYREMIAEGCAEVGRDPSEVKLLALEMAAPDNSDESRDAMRRGRAFYCASPHYMHIADVTGLGDDFRRVKAVWENERDYKKAASLVTDEMIETFTSTGADEKVAARLQWLIDEGVYPIVYPVPRHSLKAEDHWTTADRVAKLRS